MSKQLTVLYSRSSDAEVFNAYGLHVEVTDAVEMPSEIFVYQRGTAPPPGSGEAPRDVFFQIADPLDLETLPVDEPYLAEEIPYYRTSSVDLLFRSPITREETEQLIKETIATLVHTLNSVDITESTEEVVYD